ncbi:MAG: DUF5050 domain-containing protein [Lachnospiraceae bacterium]|nr:DUF5050 domain-containing protein [Lachnospiraceae bacterium]
MASDYGKKRQGKSYRILAMMLAFMLAVTALAGCKESGGGGGGGSDVYENNSNFQSMGGTITHYNGYTYYIQAGKDNDGSGNGSADSDNIYRISDDKDAEPELIYSVPAEIVYGTEQWTMYGLTASNGKLWVMNTDMQYEAEDLYLTWISLDGSESGRSESYDLGGKKGSFIPIGVDGGRYYFRGFVYTDDRASSMFQFYFDTNTETWGQIDTSFLKENEMAAFLTAGAGYLYYVKATVKDGYPDIDNGIYRIKTTGGAPEEVAGLNMEEFDPDDGNYYYANDKYFYYLLDNDEYAIYAIRLADGENIKVLGREEGLQERYFPTFCIAGDEIWFMNDSGLYKSNAEGGNVEKIAEDPEMEDKQGVAVCGDWIFYSLNDHPQYTRIAKDGRIFPKEELVVNSWDRITSDHEDGTWCYKQYPRVASIYGYNGSETKVTVPSEIDGLPVTMVGGHWDKEKLGGIKELIIPEGVKAINYIYIEGLKKITLPSTLEFFTHRNFVYSFRTDGELIVEYPGTKAEFEAINERSEKLYGDMGIDAGYGDTTYVVKCSDGELKIDPNKE